MSRYTLPSDWADSPCYVVSIHSALIPIIIGQLRLLEARGSWIDQTNYQRGYNAVLEFEACVMAACLNDMLDIQRATYRMLDTAIYGTAYTIESTDPLVVSPEIPAARDLAFSDQDSVLGRLDRVNKLVDNSVNGTSNDLYSASPSVKDLLQSIIDAMSSETTDLDSILSQLETVVLLLG